MPTLNEIRHRPNFTSHAHKLANATQFSYEEALDAMNICMNVDVAFYYLLFPMANTELRYALAYSLASKRWEETHETID